MILLQNGLLMNPNTKREEKVDILIEGNRIKEINPVIKGIASKGAKEEKAIKLSGKEKTIRTDETDNEMTIVDAKGLVIAPGLIDVHTHFRDPGFTYKEDIESGAKAAVAGGYTTVIMMANTKPVIDNLETLSYCIEKGRSTPIHVYADGAVTSNLAGMELADMVKLKENGAVGFTDDGIPIMDEAVVEAAMECAAKLNVPLSFHEEDKRMISQNGINHGEASDFYKIEGSPSKAEYSLVERDLKLAVKTGAIVNIQHISTKEAVAMVRKAKKIRGNRIHAEATPHHIALTQEAVIQKGSLAKVNPPLRTKEDRQAIIEGLKDGTIDLIATDHAPHAKEEKDKPIVEAPSGMLGLETALAIANTVLVKEEGMSLMEVLEKMTCNPADMYGLDSGRIEEGKLADLILFAPDEKWTVNKFHSKSQNSPFIGETLTGKVKMTICRGKIVYNEL